MKPSLLLPIHLIFLAPLVQGLESVDDELLGSVTGQEDVTMNVNYGQDIEEFLYTDADGAGNGNQEGTFAIKGIHTGNQFNPNFDISTRTSDGKILVSTTLAANDNTVITKTNTIGYAGEQITKAENPDRYTELRNRGIDVDDNGLLASGIALHDIADGIDVRIDELNVGNSDGTNSGTLGAINIVNQSNYFSSLQAATANSKYGFDLDESQSNQFLKLESRITVNSDDNISIISESGGTVQSAYYTDTDSTDGNQIGVLEISKFRVVDNNNFNDQNVSGIGRGIRGQRSETTLSAGTGADGSIRLNQKSTGSTIINKIFTGNAQAAHLHNEGVIGGISILSRQSQSTTTISAH